MYPRTEYEMTQKDLNKILSACKPTPVMFLSGGTPIGGSQQENANGAWSALGKKMGFDYLTVRPIEGKSNRFFTAVPSETEGQREERLAKEQEEKKLQRVNELKKEIADREKELKELARSVQDE
jgi:hypothetical protein